MFSFYVATLAFTAVLAHSHSVNPVDSQFALFRRAEDDDFSPRWCGKRYQANSSADSDIVLAGQTPIPLKGTLPLLSFRCRPAIRPYVDDDTTVTFVLDTLISYDVGQPLPVNPSAIDGITVGIALTSSASSDTVLDGVRIPLNISGYEAQVDITKFATSSRPHNVTCVAGLNLRESSLDRPSITFEDAAHVYRLPNNPYLGSATKMDLRTGGLLRRDGSSGTWQPFLPFGFYTYTDNLISNLSMIDAMVKDGLNVIHLVPTFAETLDINALGRVLDRADELGMLYIADFRDKYKKLADIESLVRLYRSRKNLLAWYTTDEPDGPGDDHTSTMNAYSYLYEMDGYHPVSLVLNCADFRWNDYTKGTDIVLSDVYPIAVNVTYSKRYHTICNATYGCCGCDNCSGSLSDIGNRLDTWAERRRWLGRQRDLAFWTVPQGFDGTNEFWERVPTGAEFKVQGVLGLIHGAVGITPWANPYDNPDIARAAAEIAGFLTKQAAPLVLDPTARRVALATNASSVDAAAWIISGQEGNTTVLVLTANMGAEPITASADVAALFNSGSVSIQSIETLLGGAAPRAAAEGSTVVILSLEPTGVAGYVLALNVSSDSNMARPRSASSSQLHGLSWALAVSVFSALVLA